MRKTSARLFCISVGICLAHCFPAFAQVTTGTPPFGSFGGGPDMVNLANLNAHVDVPVLNKTGRGMPFSYNLSYDTSVWYPVGTSGSEVWTPVYNFGWRGQTEANTGYISSTSSTHICYYYVGRIEYVGGIENSWSNFVYHDAWGIPHPFAGTAVYDTGSGNGGCPPARDTGFTSTTTDGSGYTITVPPPAGGGTTTVTSRSGIMVTPPSGSGSGAATSTETNGNEITINSSGQFFDTLSSTTAVLTVAGTAPSPTTFTYTTPTGSNASYTIDRPPNS